MSAPLSRSTRRQFLAGLLATACAPKPSPKSSSFPEQARFGWRWAVGQAHRWRATLHFEDGDQRMTRVEAWRYVATDVLATGATVIEGQLTGVGFHSEALGGLQASPSTEALLSTTEDRVQLILHLTGHIELRNAPPGPQNIPHLALATGFPSTRHAEGARWDDVSPLLPAAQLFPASVPVHAEGETRWVATEGTPKGERVLLDHRGTLSLGDDRLPVRVEGESIWKTFPGVLLERTLRMTVPESPRQGLAESSLQISLLHL